MKHNIFFKALVLALLVAGGGMLTSCEKEPLNPKFPLTNEEKIIGVWAEDINENPDGVNDTLVFHSDGKVSSLALFDNWQYQLSDERILFYKDPGLNYPPQLISGDSLTFRYTFVNDDTVVFYNFLTLSVGSTIYDVKYHKISDL